MTAGSRRSASGPWTVGQLLPPLAAQVAGLAVLGVAFAVARQQATVPAQEGWATLAVLGAILSGAGNGWLLLAGRRAVAGRRQRLFGAVSAGTADPPPAWSGTERVTAAGMTRYHRPDCTLVAGKTVLAVNSGDCDAGLSPCDWCLA